MPLASVPVVDCCGLFLGSFWAVCGRNMRGFRFNIGCIPTPRATVVLPPRRRRRTSSVCMSVCLPVYLFAEENTSLSDAALSLHSSWFAAITLSCRSGTDCPPADCESAFDGGSAAPATTSIHQLGGSAATAGDAQGRRSEGSERRRAAYGETVGGGSWLRARLSMPVWPFSDEHDCVGGDEAPTEDSGGYWNVDVRTNAGAGGYSLWRIPAADGAWQGGSCVAYVCACVCV